MHIELVPTESQVQRASQSSIGIAVSSYNENKIAADRIMVVTVPGAWELPFACQRLVAMRDMAGVIALGAVIKGETSHDQHINRAVSNALMQLSLDHNKPIAFGLLTVNSLEQAIHRSGGNKGNKGEECAQALLSCLQLGVALNDLSEDVSY